MVVIENLSPQTLQIWEEERLHVNGATTLIFYCYYSVLLSEL